jgi:Arc/MetJ-type ribon-helix-helix transcriptional regulator
MSRRLQLILPDQSFDRLERLVAKTEAQSMAEVIRNAMRLYEALIDEAEKGNDLYIETPQGQRTRVLAIS